MPQTSHRLGVAALPLALAVPAGSARAQEARMDPVTVDGEHLRLEMRVHEPANGAPAPTLVFNHGSTGWGTDPASFTRPLDFPEVARFFVARGWAADRALRDVEAAMDAIVAMPFVDQARVVIGGQSRGGVLSVAYAGGHARRSGA